MATEAKVRAVEEFAQVLGGATLLGLSALWIWLRLPAVRRLK